VDAVLERHAAGKSTSGLIAITFDDACLSVRALAVPMLRDAGAPASIFVVRDAAERGSTYWWDRLSLLENVMSADEWAVVRGSHRTGRRRECRSLGARPRHDRREASRRPAARSAGSVRGSRGTARNRKL
jgi:hypothetical protein